MTVSIAPALAVPSALALVAYVVAMVPRRDAAARAALVLAWVAQGAAIAVDLLGLGAATPGARFGFAPALSVTAWMVIAVYGIESRLGPWPGVRRWLAALGAALVALAWAFPGESRPHLASPWEPLHWVLGFSSYGLFGSAVLHAVLWSHSERRLRLKVLQPRPAQEPGAAGGAPGLPLLKLESLTFGFVAAGFVMLSATLLLGWWFAAPWLWTHKTVFSMLAWAVFAALLAGRQVLGWRGRLATRWLYAGSALLLLAYVGSRFVLEVVLRRSPGSY